MRTPSCVRSRRPESHRADPIRVHHDELSSVELSPSQRIAWEGAVGRPRKAPQDRLGGPAYLSGSPGGALVFAHSTMMPSRRIIAMKPVMESKIAMAVSP